MHDLSPIKERILQYIEFQGVSKYKFYKDSDITRGVLDSSSGISEENITRFIAYARNIDVRWLITGKGEMLVESLNSDDNKSQKPEELEDPLLVDCKMCEMYEQMLDDKDRLIDVLERESATMYDIKEALQREVAMLRGEDPSDDTGKTA